MSIPFRTIGRTARRTARRAVVRTAVAAVALVVTIPAVASAANPFTDVPSGQWFSDAVEWAYDKGITTGVSPTEFGGEQGFTRYQAVTMLERMDTKIIQPGLDQLGAQLNGVRDDMSTIHHAVLNGDGTLETGPSSPGVSLQKLDTGRYEVDFPVDISGCAWQATLVVAHDGGVLLAQPDPVAGSVGLAPRFDGALDDSAIYVETWDENGANADRDVTVSVICTPEDDIFIGPVLPVGPVVSP